MGRDDWAALEEDLAVLLGRGEREEALTRAWKAYAPKLLGYLATVLDDDDDARDALAQASEHAWKGLAGFRGESTVRSWLYRLAWNAAMTQLRVRERRHERRLETPEDFPEARRETTAQHRRTSVRGRVAELRRQLDPAEQTLLTLRVDRGLSWNEIAHVMDAEAPALRKRYERLKSRLRAMVVDDGLLAPPDPE